MIILPSKKFNRYCKKIRPKWQHLYSYRLGLLNFIPVTMWRLSDWELVGPIPPEIMNAISTYPVGTTSVMSTPPPGGVNLSGSSGTPNRSTAQTNNGTAAQSQWIFYGDNAPDTGIAREGRVAWSDATMNANSLLNFNIDVEWHEDQDVVDTTWYLRYTLNSGQTSYYNTGTPGGTWGTTWHKLSDTDDSGTTITFLVVNAPFSSPNPKVASFKAELSQDQSTVDAEGYYENYAIRS